MLFFCTSCLVVVGTDLAAQQQWAESLDFKDVRVNVGQWEPRDDAPFPKWETLARARVWTAPELVGRRLALQEDRRAAAPVISTDGTVVGTDLNLDLFTDAETAAMQAGEAPPTRRIFVYRAAVSVPGQAAACVLRAGLFLPGEPMDPADHHLCGQLHAAAERVPVLVYGHASVVTTVTGQLLHRYPDLRRAIVDCWIWPAGVAGRGEEAVRSVKRMLAIVYPRDTVDRTKVCGAGVGHGMASHPFSGVRSWIPKKHARACFFFRLWPLCTDPALHQLDGGGGGRGDRPALGGGGLVVARGGGRPRGRLDLLAGAGDGPGVGGPPAGLVAAAAPRGVRPHGGPRDPGRGAGAGAAEPGGPLPHQPLPAAAAGGGGDGLGAPVDPPKQRGAAADGGGPPAGATGAGGAGGQGGGPPGAAGARSAPSRCSRCIVASIRARTSLFWRIHRGSHSATAATSWGSR